VYFAFITEVSTSGQTGIKTRLHAMQAPQVQI